ncbi:hypothetical protein B0H11DRAFT_1919883 [Mycena galericulata]|nr:hypothetical protein B0H11DRAFT_1919883 [Mycena galericulata]
MILTSFQHWEIHGIRPTYTPVNLVTSTLKNLKQRDLLDHCCLTTQETEVAKHNELIQQYHDALESALQMELDLKKRLAAPALAGFHEGYRKQLAQVVKDVQKAHSKYDLQQRHADPPMPASPGVELHLSFYKHASAWSLQEGIYCDRSRRDLRLLKASSRLFFYPSPSEGLEVEHRYPDLRETPSRHTTCDPLGTSTPDDPGYVLLKRTAGRRHRGGHIGNVVTLAGRITPNEPVVEDDEGSIPESPSPRKAVGSSSARAPAYLQHTTASYSRKVDSANFDSLAPPAPPRPSRELSLRRFDALSKPVIRFALPGHEQQSGGLSDPRTAKASGISRQPTDTGPTLASALRPTKLPPSHQTTTATTQDESPKAEFVATSRTSSEVLRKTSLTEASAGLATPPRAAFILTPQGGVSPLPITNTLAETKAQTMQSEEGTAGRMPPPLSSMPYFQPLGSDILRQNIDPSVVTSEYRDRGDILGQNTPSTQGRRDFPPHMVGVSSANQSVASPPDDPEQDKGKARARTPSPTASARSGRNSPIDYVQEIYYSFTSARDECPLGRQCQAFSNELLSKFKIADRGISRVHWRPRWALREEEQNRVFDLIARVQELLDQLARLTNQDTYRVDPKGTLCTALEGSESLDELAWAFGLLQERLRNATDVAYKFYQRGKGRPAASPATTQSSLYNEMDRYGCLDQKLKVYVKHPRISLLLGAETIRAFTADPELLLAKLTTMNVEALLWEFPARAEEDEPATWVWNKSSNRLEEVVDTTWTSRILPTPYVTSRSRERVSAVRFAPSVGTPDLSRSNAEVAQAADAAIAAVEARTGQMQQAVHKVLQLSQ